MVLEVGFGPGIGLTEAWKRIKDGKGRVYGIDISQAMLESATHKLEKQIASGKVNLAIGDVMRLPFEENTFDRIFHTNCFYFWSEPLTCAKELRRVMKPEALMITGMNVAGVQKVKGDGYMKYGNPDLEMYLETLKSAGYSEIVREDIKHEGKEVAHTFIYASPNKN
ncbi:hypothetical protein FSP39_011152 [Pinctada imbricata]|uniref:Methyltransferase type 11 domain-containing protein n=1 Tax=Pinctada imbricata TaxID=66713 RepID=A0AA89BKD3_PINIB|nr:hypothetical protein FSP39_011152 [Pinctada imbricata]